MSLSPTALEALRAAQQAFSTTEADVFEDALARGLEAVDGEGRLVGAHSAEELLRLRAQVIELEVELAQARQANAALKESAKQLLRRGRDVPVDGITQRVAPTQALREVPDGEHYAATHHEYRVGHDLPETGGAR